MKQLADESTLYPMLHKAANSFTQTGAHMVETLQTKGRLILLLPFGLMLGIFIGKYYYLEAIIYAFVLPVILSVAWLMGINRQLFSITLPLCLSLCVGIALLPVHAFRAGTHMWQGFQTVKLSGQLDQISQNMDGDYVIVLNHLSSQQALNQPLPQRARLVMRFTQVPHVGDWLHFHARLGPVPKPDLPHMYDTQFHRFFDQIGAYGRGLSDTEIFPSDRHGLAISIQRWRQRAGDLITQTMTPNNAAFAKAIMVGDQRSISPAQRDIFARTGLSHMLAISGLHLSIVAWAVFLVCRRLLALSTFLSNHVPIRAIAVVCGMLAAVSYLALSGFSISATRATIMMGIIFLALLMGRRALTMRNVAVAAMIILLLNPASMFTASFQLSFAAVIGLVGYFEWRNRFMHKNNPGKNFVVNYLSAAIVTSIIAGIYTSVFSLWHFGQIAPLGAIANVVAMPLFALLVMPICMLALTLMPFVLHESALIWAQRGIALIHDWAQWLDSLAISPDRVVQPSLFAMTLFVLALCWFAIWPAKGRFIGILVFIPVLITQPFKTPPDLIVLDRVQQIYLNTNNVYQAQLHADIHPRLSNALKHQFGADIFSTDPVHVEDTMLQRNDIYIHAPTANALRQACRAKVKPSIIISKRRAPKDCQNKYVLDSDHFAQFGTTYVWSDQETKFKTAIKNPTLPWR